MPICISFYLSIFSYSIVLAFCLTTHRWLTAIMVYLPSFCTTMISCSSAFGLRGFKILFCVERWVLHSHRLIFYDYYFCCFSFVQTEQVCSLFCSNIFNVCSSKSGWISFSLAINWLFSVFKTHYWFLFGLPTRDYIYQVVKDLFYFTIEKHSWNVPNTDASNKTLYRTLIRNTLRRKEINRQQQQQKKNTQPKDLCTTTANNEPIYWY